MSGAKKEICPECGKRAIEVRKYTDGSRLYIHTKILKSEPFLHFDTTDSCYVKA